MAARPSPSIAESTAGHEAVTVDPRAASEVPWGDVGPGWFLLGFDPEQSTPNGNWDDGWLLGSGETWLLSPEGEAFLGPQPPAESEVISFWSGAVAWFATPDRVDPSCGEFTCGEVVSVDARTGAQGHPWASVVPWPGRLESTATGSLLWSDGCCGSWFAYLVDAEGVSTPVADGGLPGGGILTPDGTALFWSEEIRDADGESGSMVLRTKVLYGGEEVVASIADPMRIAGWTDASTVLLDTVWYGDADHDFSTLDLADGAISPWDSPVKVFDGMRYLGPGMWLWGLPDSSDSVVTNNDGSLRIDLECAGLCYPVVSGDRLIWSEETSTKVGDTWVDLTQRLTLVNLTTGEQTIVFDGEPSQGRIVAIAPHANAYD
ncbi:MAG: hypothetical protein JW722_03885 [Demequinaceae bacterium]|nr:hypothetical protein [Demequinaceae bacterium]